MNRLVHMLSIATIIFILSSCGDSASINQDEASDVIVEYLETHPVYSTASFNFGEMTFRGSKDQAELDQYKALEAEGIIEMTLQEGKKRFLSKDSTFVYLVKLTDEAAPLVLKQNNNRATVKSVIYVLDDSEPVNFVTVNDKIAKATVSLKKERTEFSVFEKGSNAADFMTKTYKLRLKKDEGWEVTGE